ncbi:hypothetical protein A2X44_03415 [candidate division CPR3 bacterium GWF2_35_18]|uniref:Uncharacterized protein n=1 Tax=candidate division CPR3 bacterium GW2011_GWF2_35_18 TaxID=1618350 RepID=A0A0G0C0C2_UNCC3|nr:MAG: hypothetical protein UR67_C0005G0045 [candidate division CPR3 bacterium GW2011_GWF2_35_18]KKP86410.1 MAG: hypothetical protein UR87_C0020G0002 [candidate division CPR3 bacterium GW2011_GWE2_35_7]OGB63028.1 MAG: hypothetical protein A2X44_03415 [candidate division CPR3 bacterium GWF2_35_18]OGB63948.1 MAG: hypothetical protein A2250_02790 [candidate division CPR3 bacterium RIFOXYA2_FULL_35_13]OGB76102.1 MAG: hypothetical protein A2476_00085 [candidate division CPR3 bacterium RIFOXYC2_FULL
MKSILNKIKLNISKLKDKLQESKLLHKWEENLSDKGKQICKYIKTHPKQSLVVASVIVIIITIGVYLVSILIKPKPITTTPHPFTEVTTYKLNSVPTKIEYGKFNSELREFPSNISIYQTKEKPLSGLQEIGNLQRILQTLGFTSDARNYSNKKAIAYYEKGKSLTVTLIGDKISFSTGLNVEPELLQQTNDIRSLSDLLQTGKYFFSENGLNFEIQFSDPKTVYSRMGELGLYEINNVEQADVVTYILQPQIESLNIANNQFLPYISLTKNGKIVAFSIFNKKIVAATKNPVISISKLKKSIQNNEAVSLSKIETKYLEPQSIVIKSTQVLYYYNEAQEVLTPVVTLQVTLKKDGEEKEATLYLPAFENKYYY